MKKYKFLDFFLDSLLFYFGNIERDGEYRDLSFIHFSQEGNNTFVIIEDYIVESLVVLGNLLSEEKIVFSCGVIYEKEVIAGVEVCINSLDLEKLNERFY